MSMEISKLIIAGKKNLVAVKQSGVASVAYHQSKSDSSKVAVLEAFCSLMDSIETNETISDVVAHIFLPDVIYKPFINGTVASYIRLGKTRNGMELSLDELKAYDKAYDMYLARAKNLVIRTSEFKALDNGEEKVVKNEIKALYTSLANKLEEAKYQPQVVVQQNDNSEAIAKITEQILEASAQGDIAKITALTEAIKVLNSAPATPVISTTTANTTPEITAQPEKTEEAQVEPTEVEGGIEGLNITIKKADGIPAGLAAFQNMQ